jgi:hypothetical protein
MQVQRVVLDAVRGHQFQGILLTNRNFVFTGDTQVGIEIHRGLVAIGEVHPTDLLARTARHSTAVERRVRLLTPEIGTAQRSHLCAVV